MAKGDLGQLVQEVGLRYKELNPNNKVNYHIHIETEDTEIFCFRMKICKTFYLKKRIEL